MDLLYIAIMITVIVVFFFNLKKKRDKKQAWLETISRKAMEKKNNLKNV